MKTKKRKKVSRMHGKGRGTHGWGERKKHKKSGHHGGGGMSGSGKRADHKKTFVTKKYGHGYFGKKGITSKKTQRDKRKRISIGNIELNLDRYLKKGLAKKTDSGFEINLEGYKILGNRKDSALKNKLIIKAQEASNSAIEKVKKAGGNILLSKKEIKGKEKEEKEDEK